VRPSVHKGSGIWRRNKPPQYPVEAAIKVPGPARTTGSDDREREPSREPGTLAADVEQCLGAESGMPDGTDGRDSTTGATQQESYDGKGNDPGKSAANCRDPAVPDRRSYLSQEAAHQPGKHWRGMKATSSQRRSGCCSWPAAAGPLTCFRERVPGCFRGSERVRREAGLRDFRLHEPRHIAIRAWRSRSVRPPSPLDVCSATSTRHY